MNTSPATPELCQRLKAVGSRATVKENVSLSRYTRLGVGGTAQVWLNPASLTDLRIALMWAQEQGLPVVTLGLGSNVLIRDGGIDGLVLKLPKKLRDLSLLDESPAGTVALMAQAGETDLGVAKQAAALGLSGLEFWVGIPGSVGGAVVMNAGCFGGQTADVLHRVTLMTPAGEVEHWPVEDLLMTYRDGGIGPHHLVLGVTLALHPGHPQRIIARMKHIEKQRTTHQPTTGRTCGSTFKNPAGHRAWQLIEQAGGRGLCRGDAMMSKHHCNFLINQGKACADDLEQLGFEVIERVNRHHGISLEWEVQRLGHRLENPGGQT